MASEKRLSDVNALIGRMEERQASLVRAWGHRDHHARGFAEAVDIVKKAPTVDAVEVVHGEWLFDSNRERYFCSACNEEALYTSRDVPEYDYDWEENLRYSHTETLIEEHLTDYCPNCGAKMDGDGNG